MIKDFLSGIISHQISLRLTMAATTLEGKNLSFANNKTSFKEFLESTLEKNLQSDATPLNAAELIEKNKNDLKNYKEFLAFITKKQETTDDNESSTPVLVNWYNQSVYYFTVNFGFFKTFLESFISLRVTLDSFHFLSNAAVNVLSVIFGILNLILFYAFEVSLIRESLDIDTSVNESIDILGLYQEQLKVAKAINHWFYHTKNNFLTKLEPQEKTQAEDFIKEMNQSFKDKIKVNQPFSFPKQVLKYSVYGLGALSCVVGEYFVSQYLLEALTSVVNLSPVIHWTLTAFWLAYTLATYHALSGSSVLSLINPEFSKLKDLSIEHAKLKKEIETSERLNGSMPSLA